MPAAFGADAATRLAAARTAQTEARTLEGRNAFLATASLSLGQSLDLETTAETVARLPIPLLGVAVLVDVLREDHSVRRIAVAHETDDGERRLRHTFEEFVINPASPQAAVIASGSPQLGQVDDDDRALYAGTDAESALLRELHFRTYVVLPLRTRGTVHGCITLLSTGRHNYGVAEFTTASEYARRASLAMEHALLYREAVRARGAAEEAEAQFRQLVNGFRESEDRYRGLFQDSHDAIYVTRRDGQFIEANPATIQMFGYTREELMRLNAHALYVDVTERERFRAAIEENGSVRRFEVKLCTKSGRVLDCILSSMIRRGPSGEVIGYQGIIHDVTATRESELRLRDSEHFTRTIISSVQQGVTVFDRDLRYQVFNRFMEELTGLDAKDVIGRRPEEVFPDTSSLVTLLERALAGETVTPVDGAFHIPQTGRQGWASAVYSPHVSPSGETIGVVGIVVDITERKEAEDQLTHNAFHDGLTGLPNRALFADRLERLIRHAERHPEYLFAVAFLDLDRFKIVNDSLGHLVGDELLVAIGQRLAGCLRLGDTVARLGGDEFALLLHDVHDIADATRVAERILTDLAQPFELSGHELFSNVSIGIALSNGDYEKPEELLRDADIAMYRAKLEGRSRFEVFDRDSADRVTHGVQFETDLRRALDRNEFVLHYQPIVSLADGKITGTEALIRWIHPQRGIVAPDEFIPLAEDTGLIVPIGWWVLEEACRQIVTWNRDSAAPLSLSVNLSTKQFLQGDLLEQLDRVLTRTGIDPAWLHLEITESVVIRHESRVAATLGDLRARGVHLSLDDFGTGYSSLNYLHTFPIDTLKIDRSFVAQIDATGLKRGLVETIVALGRNLGMTTIAEGVETREQLEFLRVLGSELAQGYFFSPALAAEEFEQLLELNPVW
ncbi:MAG: EAL domain-containing protein [Longimicrobiales bacterium]